MPIHKPTAGADFSGNRSAELIGELVLLSRLSDELHMETKNGPSEYVRVHALIATDDGGLRNLGEIPVFWTAIRSSLLRDCPIGEWTGGRIEQPEGKTYYVLNVPTLDEYGDLGAVVDSIEQGRELPPVETPDDAVTDGEPF